MVEKKTNNEDLDDEMIDFELMLEGILVDEVINEKYKERILCKWYALATKIKKEFEQVTSK